MAMFELLDEAIERGRQRTPLRTTIVLAMVFAFLAGANVPVLVFKIKNGGDWAVASVQLTLWILLAVHYAKGILSHSRVSK
jgi:VIT1/CCC1 family predicted Fe2+/Mn2+ transporter